MARDSGEFRGARQDRLARERPLAYRIRLSALFLLGYAYFALISAVVAFAAGALAYFMNERGVGAAIPAVLITFILTANALRAALGRIRHPETGVQVHRSDAPELWDRIDTMRKRIRAPRVHRVWITDDVGASVSRVFRFFPYPRPTIHLQIGLPALWVLRKDLFSAVLAHEIGHVAGGRSHFASSIWTTRRLWIQLLMAVDTTEHWSAFLLRGFVRWYAPRFATYSMSLARAAEHEADEAAARVAGGDYLAAALARLQLGDRLLYTDYWPRIHLSVASQAEPPNNVISGMRPLLQAPLTDPRFDRWIGEIMAARTDAWATHPSMGDRLTAYGVPGDGAILPHSVQSLMEGEIDEASSAAQLLGDLEHRIGKDLDDEYARMSREGWNRRHRELRQVAGRLDALNRQAVVLPLTPGEKLDRIAWTAELNGSAAALPLARSFAGDPVNASNAEAKLVLGRLLLETDDAEGIEHLDAAMRLDPNFTASACNLASTFLDRTGRTVEAAAYRLKRSDIDGAERKPIRERHVGRYTNHGLDTAATRSLTAAFARQQGVQRAWLVRLAHRIRSRDVMLNEQQLLLAVQPRRGQSGTGLIDPLIAELQAGPQEQSLAIIVLEGKYRRWQRAIERTPDALLYDATTPVA